MERISLSTATAMLAAIGAMMIVLRDRYGTEHANATGNTFSRPSSHKVPAA